MDVVCTLLRQAGGMLLAENTFAVQTKATSVRAVEYKEHEVRWLHDVDVPFFLLSVDVAQAKAALYTFASAFFMKDFAPTTFLLDRPDGAGNLPWFQKRNAEGGLDCWLGPPIDEFTFQELQDPERCDALYALTKSWCEALASVLRSRRLGVYQLLEWKTGQSPFPGRSTTEVSTSDGLAEFVRLVSDVAPALGRIRLLLEHLKHFDPADSLHTFATHAQALGVKRGTLLSLLTTSDRPSAE